GSGTLRSRPARSRPRSGPSSTGDSSAASSRLLRARSCGPRPASLHHELAAQHPHLAGELVLPRLVRDELQRNDLPLGQLRRLAEGGQEHHLRARGALIAAEAQAHWLAVLDDDDVRGVATFDEDERLLVAARRHRGAPATPLGPPEEPGDQRDQYNARRDHEDVRRGHGLVSFGRHSFSRFALLTTVTELKLIARPARIGERRIPKKG